jgi:WD repeat-containing protein 35
MLVYLSKKIAIPGQIKLNCISWNRDQGWIACGGDAGLLKVLKLEQASGPDAQMGGVAAPSNLSMNQTLEGHTGGVMCVTWNPLFRKLTTSDESGLIIVWMMHNGMWYEEMINNRNKSVVRDMKWTTDGRKICIIYEDGAVIVGSVDGNRLWGKEMGLSLRFVEWSPDGRFIVFVTMSSDVLLYDAEGTRIKAMPLPVRDFASGSDNDGDAPIVAIHWHAPEGGGAAARRAAAGANKEHAQPALCIALASGFIQLSRGDDDPNAVFVNTDMRISGCRWSSNGNILAVTGSHVSKRGDGVRVINQVKFYDAYGKYLRNIRIPGDSIAGLTWEGGGLRIALAVDSNIFFANIRPAYTWAYLLNTVVYSYMRGSTVRGGGPREHTVVFWDLASGEAHPKHVGQLKFLAAVGDVCAVVVLERGTQAKPVKKLDDYDGGKESEPSDAPSSSSSSSGTPERHVVQLRNSIGVIVDSKPLPVGFVPKAVCMGPSNFIACNDRTVYSWQYSTGGGSRSAATADSSDEGGNSSGGGSGGLSDEKRALSRIAAGRSTTQSKERMFDIESAGVASAQPPETFKMVMDAVEDPIACVCCSDKFLVLARKSGSITRFTLPHLNPENTYTVRCEPFRVALNSISSRLALIDAGGVLSLCDLDVRLPDKGDEAAAAAHEGKDAEGGGSGRAKASAEGTPLGPHFGRKLPLERRDVWDVLWAEDNDELLCVMEKNKMVVFRGEAAEEPVVSSGYLARFRDLEVRAVSMDDLLLHPDQPNRACVVDFETKSLREVREKIAAGGLAAGYASAEKMPGGGHPRLWKLLATAALEDMDLNMAERAFVRCGDYHGIKFVQQLRTMPDKMKARAEVAVHLHNFDEAEGIYREIDRKDLAVQMRRKVGDYGRVVDLLRTGGGSDQQVREAWDRIGEQFADKFHWKKAVQYFAQSRNVDRLAECYYRLENFAELAKLSKDVADGTPLLAQLAARFEALGMHEEAVDCHLRSGNPKAAVDCCVVLNRWDVALELAERHDFPQVEGLLTRYALALNARGRRLEAVELFRRANRPTEAALLIGDIAEQVARRELKPSLAKKLHVLAAYEVERHRKRAMDLATQATMQGGTDGQGTAGIAQATAATLETLMMTNLDTQVGTAAGTVTATMADGGKKASKAFGNAWRGAAAYHYYMLALRQFYAGSMDAAMKTSIKLCEYDDVLDPKDIYSLLCLTSLRCRFFGICSKAFVKLETLPTLTDAERDAVQTLAVKIFVSNRPEDPTPLPDPYLKCIDVGRGFKACVITGRAIQESETYMCKTCRYLMLEHERVKPQAKDGSGGGLVNCPLCHSSIAASASAAERREQQKQEEQAAAAAAEEARKRKEERERVQTGAGVGGRKAPAKERGGGGPGERAASSALQRASDNLLARAGNR